MNVLAYVHLRNIYNSTGAGRTARQVVEHLCPLDDIRLCVLADQADHRRIVPLVGDPWVNYLYKTFQADTSWQQLRWLMTNGPAAELYWPQAEVVYCTAESYVPVRKARLVVTAHDAGYFDDGAHRRDPAFWQTRLKWQLLFRKLAQKVDMIHTVSEFSRERLSHHFPALASRIRAVHNGVTPHFFGPVSLAGASFVSEAGLAERAFVLVPGGLHFRKNAELILAASALLLKRFPQLVIAVVNHNNPAYLPGAVKLGDRFRLLGFVTDEALHALYASAAVVWYPSRYEGFGLPVLEAMACGAAVVASNSSSLPEIAGDAALLVDPSRPEAHAEAVASLLTDERARGHFATVGRARAQRFTWQATAEQLKSHFESLL